MTNEEHKAYLKKKSKLEKNKIRKNKETVRMHRQINESLDSAFSDTMVDKLSAPLNRHTGNVEYISQGPLLGFKLRFDKKNKGISVTRYQTVKIRHILQKIYGRYGYPVRFMEYIGYFSGIALWIPEDWVILKYDTKLMWLDEPATQWRFVKIAKIVPDIDDLATAPGMEGEKIKAILNGLGKFIDTIIDWSPGQWASKTLTIKRIPIFENLPFYNTTHDVIIDKNWGKIKMVLRKNGYAIDE